MDARRSLLKTWSCEVKLDASSWVDRPVTRYCHRSSTFQPIWNTICSFQGHASGCVLSLGIYLLPYPLLSALLAIRDDTK
jgi:hypothetical protein